MEKYSSNWFKFILGVLLCLLIRMIPFRPPNIEPILATQMPFSKAYGPFVGFSFAFLSILLFDFLTRSFGVWSFFTSLTYGVLGIWAFYFFKNRESNKWNYAKFAIIGTLFFDMVTGLLIGPLFFNQSFIQALMGQIPFTLWHLLGNVSFAVILSPAIHHYIIENQKLHHYSPINIFSLDKNI